jgi:lipopolysaccharide/colanic/teichoic acid biosynthesis glycosyltransferase
MSFSHNSPRGEYAPRRKVDPLSRNLLSLVAATLRPEAVSHKFHSPETIKAILHRECARCERSGNEFCLVVIDPGADVLAAKKIGELLLEQVRQADEIGYLDESKLCVLLTYTSPTGAEQFMARFMHSAKAVGQTPLTQLFVYPSDNFENRDLGEQDRRAKPLLAEIPSAVASSIDGKVAGVEEFLARKSPLWKRATDIILAGWAVLFLWPLGLVIALAIKLTSKGPVFFTQWRLGLGGRPFLIYKFRTMVPNADLLKDAMLNQNEQDGPAFKMARDPRVTRIGRLLRTTSLDELPQLLNVLRGDMSLVGPRPLPVAEALACHVWQKRRLDVVPGLTCTWQIKGRGTVSFAEWARMDREYIRRRSFLHDAKLLAMTIPAVIGRKGAM